MTLDQALKKARKLATETQETLYVVKDFDEFEVSDQYEIDGFYASCPIIKAVESD